MSKNSPIKSISVREGKDGGRSLHVKRGEKLYKSIANFYFKIFGFVEFPTEFTRANGYLLDVIRSSDGVSMWVWQVWSHWCHSDLFDNRIFYQWYDWRGCLTNHIRLCILDMHAVDCKRVVFKSHINASFSCRVNQDQKSKRVFFKAFYESALEQKILAKGKLFFLDSGVAKGTGASFGFKTIKINLRLLIWRSSALLGRTETKKWTLKQEGGRILFYSD